MNMFEAWAEALLPAMRSAGDRILAIYATDFAVLEKGDASPVTEADQQAETLLLAALAQVAPGVPVVAEEAMAGGAAPLIGERFFLVDPLDGTREFISRNGEFTVNIALVERGVPVMGLVLAPAVVTPAGLGELYVGVQGRGAWRQRGHGPREPICTRATPLEGLTLLASRSHGDAAALEAYLQTRLAGRPVAALHNAGSSLKLCRLAEGAADLYPRLGRTMEWDIAAGDAVLRAAGGGVWTLAGAPLAYGKPGFENPHFEAWGRFSGPVSGSLSD